MNRSGPDANPIRRWPRATKCETASSIAAYSSDETNGASTDGSQPFTNTTGSRRSTSDWYRSWSAPVSACRPETKMIPETPRSSSISTYSSSVAPDGDCVHSTGVNPRCDSADSITWAKAGKIGLINSGITSPIRPADRRRSRVGRSKPSTSSAVRTDCLVSSATPGLPFSTRETVASLTPALAAISASRALLLTPGTVPSSHLTFQQDPARTCRLRTDVHNVNRMDTSHAAYLVRTSGPGEDRRTPPPRGCLYSDRPARSCR